MTFRCVSGVCVLNHIFVFYMMLTMIQSVLSPYPHQDGYLNNRLNSLALSNRAVCFSHLLILHKLESINFTRDAHCLVDCNVCVRACLQVLHEEGKVMKHNCRKPKQTMLNILLLYSYMVWDYHIYSCKTVCRSNR